MARLGKARQGLFAGTNVKKPGVIMYMIIRKAIQTKTEYDYVHKGDVEGHSVSLRGLEAANAPFVFISKNKSGIKCVDRNGHTHRFNPNRWRLVFD